MTPDTIYGIILGIMAYHVTYRYFSPFLSGPRDAHDTDKPTD